MGSVCEGLFLLPIKAESARDAVHVYSIVFHIQDMEKHGRLLPCIQEIKQMLQTPIKPYTKPVPGEEVEGGGGGGGGKSVRSPRRREARKEERREDGKVEMAESKAEAAALSGDEDGELCWLIIPGRGRETCVVLGGGTLCGIEEFDNVLVH